LHDGRIEVGGILVGLELADEANMVQEMGRLEELATTRSVFRVQSLSWRGREPLATNGNGVR
jgi:hypothetical protein